MSVAVKVTASRSATRPPPERPIPRLTYAITPPNQSTAQERRRAIAAAQSERISSLPLDALLVYDVQDEAARNGSPRPFAFMPKVDPLTYALDELDLGRHPLIAYRAVAGQDERTLHRWLDRLGARNGLAVLVGAPTRQTSTSLTLPQAYSVCRTHAPEVSLGGVVIPERHRTSGTEDARVWTKMQHGCSFFVSQTVWSATTTKRLLLALRRRADAEGTGVPPILVTLSPCGSRQTLEFLEWLGVDIPDSVKSELITAPDMLARSIDLAVKTYADVRAFAATQGFDLGCNVESVSSRPHEIAASVELLRRIESFTRRDSTPTLPLLSLP